jgi:hypothetical protein
MTQTEPRRGHPGIVNASAAPETRSGSTRATSVVALRFLRKCREALCFDGEPKEVLMRKLLTLSAAIAAAMAATPAAAQIYIGIGQSPYSYNYPRYGYSPYSYGYSRYGYSSYGYSPYGYSPYAYSYSPYGSGYSYPAYGYGYSNYAYSYPQYRYRSDSCLRRHHRNGVVYYTRVC